MAALKQILLIFSNQKSFEGVIGNAAANRLGLHLFRILLSDIICFIRTLPFCFLERKLRKSFKKDGVVIIENFLDKADFQRILLEVQQNLANLPVPPANAQAGFGDKIQHQYGFDRYDGGTLNRFVNIDNNSVIDNAFIKNSRLSRLTRALFGLTNRQSKYHIYELRHGDETKNPDIQKQIHKDTFHHTYKLWYFVEAVGQEQGPFAYSCGSQRTTFKSLLWEYRMSCQASNRTHPNRGGSFRATDLDLAQMAFPMPESIYLPANTLVLADTRGFHCRSQGRINSKRIGIYANFRPIAFLPFPY